MMRQYELVERVTSYDADADEALLNKAYIYAMKAHGSQKRASGDPYFSHPLEVAAILTDLKLDDATIVAALLHDTIEDTGATKTEIDEMFGPEIGHLVEGLTKIKRLDLVSKEAAQAENLRKLLLAISDDIRVLLVKLADRLHNMRTIKHVRPDKRTRIAQETMDIYAPLAGRMGMQHMREELEDLSFEVLYPEARESIISRLEVLRKDAGNLIGEIEKEITAKLCENNIKAEVRGREKKPFSIWNKIERKSVSLGQLSDIYGFRIVVSSIDDCYRAVGAVHTAWRVVPGRFKDYISTPKGNEYRSIHTTVVGPRQKRIELQIRTTQMHDVAEHGVAAHSLYKDLEAGTIHEKGEKSKADLNGSATLDLAKKYNNSNPYVWLKRLVDMLVEGESPQEFLEHTKLELFLDQVFCFTPKGLLIPLPSGATPIDFAYAVHTDVGDSCVGCRINGRNAPLIGKLSNGDEVEIIRSASQVPPAAWEGYAVTGKARAAIRRATRDAVRAQYTGLGREILTRDLAKYENGYSDEILAAVLPKLGQNSLEGVLAAIGRGQLPVVDVIAAIAPVKKEEIVTVEKRETPSDRWFNLGRFIRLRPFRGAKSTANKPAEEMIVKSSALPVRGQSSNLPIRFAPDTGALPGDRIVGILTPEEGITVYPIHAEALQQYEDSPDRWIDLVWDVGENSRERFPAKITISAINEVGTLAQIAQTIGENDGNIENLAMGIREADFYEMSVNVGVRNLKHLNKIISGIKELPIVSSITRISG